jgi:hypothetical protein
MILVLRRKWMRKGQSALGSWWLGSFELQREAVREQAEAVFWSLAFWERLHLSG